MYKRRFNAGLTTSTFHVVEYPPFRDEAKYRKQIL